MTRTGHRYRGRVQKLVIYKSLYYITQTIICNKLEPILLRKTWEKQTTLSIKGIKLFANSIFLAYIAFSFAKQESHTITPSIPGGWKFFAHFGQDWANNFIEYWHLINVFIWCLDWSNGFVKCCRFGGNFIALVLLLFYLCLKTRSVLYYRVNYWI